MGSSKAKPLMKSTGAPSAPRSASRSISRLAAVSIATRMSPIRRGVNVPATNLRTRSWSGEFMKCSSELAARRSTGDSRQFGSERSNSARSSTPKSGLRRTWPQAAYPVATAQSLVCSAHTGANFLSWA